MFDVVGVVVECRAVWGGQKSLTREDIKMKETKEGDESLKKD